MTSNLGGVTMTFHSTAGLTSAAQLTDATNNEVFTIQQSTSATDLYISTMPPQDDLQNEPHEGIEESPESPSEATEDN